MTRGSKASKRQKTTPDATPPSIPPQQKLDLGFTRFPSRLLNQHLHSLQKNEAKPELEYYESKTEERRRMRTVRREGTSSPSAYNKEVNGTERTNSRSS